MGTKIFTLLPKQEIDFKFLSGKVLAVDAYLQLYQFLSTIRQSDGSLLVDSHGNVTSHLNGLFRRTSNLMSRNIRLVYVFDGKPPELKITELEKRASAKADAQKKYEIAAEHKDIGLMKKFASRTSRLTKDMVDDAKALLSALGIPIVQAPSEGEAQAAHLVKKGEAYALATQDADAFLFGTPRLVKNLSIVGRKKSPGKLSYERTALELYELPKILNTLSITHDQLIVLGMLVGTDYNLGGIKGIGPKKALQLVKRFGSNFEALFNEVKWPDYFAQDWQDIFNLIKNMPVTEAYDLSWSRIDEAKLGELLCDKHDFSSDNVESTIRPLLESQMQNSQQGLDKWFR